MLLFLACNLLQVRESSSLILLRLPDASVQARGFLECSGDRVWLCHPEDLAASVRHDHTCSGALPALVCPLPTSHLLSPAASRRPSPNAVCSSHRLLPSGHPCPTTPRQYDLYSMKAKMLIQPFTILVGLLIAFRLGDAYKKWDQGTRCLTDLHSSANLVISLLCRHATWDYNRYRVLNANSQEWPPHMLPFST